MRVPGIQGSDHGYVGPRGKWRGQVAHRAGRSESRDLEFTTVGEFFQAIADWHDAKLSDSDRVTLRASLGAAVHQQDDVQRPGAQAHVLRRHEGAGAGHLPATPDRVICNEFSVCGHHRDAQP